MVEGQRVEDCYDFCVFSDNFACGASEDGFSEVSGGNI